MIANQAAADGAKPPAADQQHPRRFPRLDQLFALLPLLLLVLDCTLFFPGLVESRYDIPELSAEKLLSGQAVDLGKLHLHELRVSLGTLEKHPRLNPAPNALAAAVFPGDSLNKPGLGRAGLGSFVQAVAAKLPRTDRARFSEFLYKTQGAEPGSVQVFSPEPLHAAGPLAGIDYLFVVRALKGKNQEALDALRKGLLALFAKAGDKPVSGLLLPCLTMPPRPSKDSPSFDNFFKSFFAALQSSRSPRRIDLSFYTDWPDDYLEIARTSFNNYWSAAAESHQSGLSRLYRFEPRLLLLCLSTCLLASSFHVKLNWKSFLILACAYTVTLQGSFKILEEMGPWYGEGNRPVAMIIVALVEALAFPYIVRFDPKTVFEPRQK